MEKKKQREENKKKQDEENEDKDGNEEDLERSNIPGMHKRSKIKDAIQPNLTVSIKATKIEKQKVKMLNTITFWKEMQRRKTECSWSYIQRCSC